MVGLSALSLFSENLADATSPLPSEDELDLHVPQDIFSIAYINRNNNKFLYDDFLDDAVKRGETRESSDGSQLNEEEVDNDNGYITVQERILMNAIDDSRERLQQQMLIKYDHGCSIKPLYADGTYGDAEVHRVTAADMQDFLHPLPKEVKLKFVPGAVEKNTTLAEGRTIEVRKAADGTRFTDEDPLHQANTAVPYIVEKVKGKDYFLDHDGRYFDVEDGKKKYLEPETDKSRAKLAEYNRELADDHASGRDVKRLEKDIKETLHIPEKKSLKDNFDDATKKVQKAADGLSKSFQDATAKASADITGAGAKVSQGWDNFKSGVSKQLGLG